MIVCPDDMVASRGGWSPKTVKAAWRDTETVWDLETRSGRFKRAVIMVGLPGSGKSTTAKTIDDEDTLILDSTMTVKSRREKFARVAIANGTPVCYVFLDTDKETCKERQKGRRFPVPLEAIERMAKQLENGKPPKGMSLPR